MSLISYGELLVIALLTVVKGSWAGSFTVLNNCGYPVWPGFLSKAGAPLATSGFKLLPGTTRVVETPAQWSGRVWGRTGCTFGADGKGSCVTGDSAGQLHCDGALVFPTASFVAFSQNLAGLDWYDLSLVDDSSLPPVVVAIRRGTGADIATGFVVDINLSCQEDDGDVDGNGDDDVLACKHACEAIGSPQYCCVQAYAHPNTSHPCGHSELFKTSTLTCADAYYALTFCPHFSTASTSLSTGPMVSAGTSNSNGAGRIIIGDSKLGKDISPAASSMPSWTSSTLILSGLLLIKTTLDL